MSDFKNRPEGRRIRHGVGCNSIKLHDKLGVILGVERTIDGQHLPPRSVAEILCDRVTLEGEGLDP